MGESETGQIIAERVVSDAVANFEIVHLDVEVSTPFINNEFMGLLEEHFPRKSPANLASRDRHFHRYRMLKNIELSASCIGGVNQSTVTLDELFGVQRLYGERGFW